MENNSVMIATQYYPDPVVARRLPFGYDEDAVVPNNVPESSVIHADENHSVQISVESDEPEDEDGLNDDNIVVAEEECEEDDVVCYQEAAAKKKPDVVKKKATTKEVKSVKHTGLDEDAADEGVADVEQPKVDAKKEKKDEVVKKKKKDEYDLDEVEDEEDKVLISKKKQQEVKKPAAKEAKRTESIMHESFEFDDEEEKDKVDRKVNKKNEGKKMDNNKHAQGDLEIVNAKKETKSSHRSASLGGSAKALSAKPVPAPKASKHKPVPHIAKVRTMDIMPL